MIVLKEQIEQFLPQELPFNVVINSNAKWSSIYLQTNCLDMIVEFKTYKARLTRDERTILMDKIKKFIDFHFADLSLVMDLKLQINQELNQIKDNLTIFCTANNLTYIVNDWKARSHDFDISLYSVDKNLRLDYNCSQYDIRESNSKLTHPTIGYVLSHGETPIDKSFSKTFLTKDIMQLMKNAFDLFEDIFQRQLKINNLKLEVNQLTASFKDTCEALKW